MFSCICSLICLHCFATEATTHRPVVVSRRLFQLERRSRLICELSRALPNVFHNLRRLFRPPGIELDEINAELATAAVLLDTRLFVHFALEISQTATINV